MEIVDKVYGNSNSTMCKLRLIEKLWIINHINHINDNNILNKKSGLINKCRHLNKFLLKRIKKKQWTLVLYVFEFLYFSSKHNKYIFFVLFLDKKDIICLMITLA